MIETMNSSALGVFAVMVIVAIAVGFGTFSFCQHKKKVELEKLKQQQQAELESLKELHRPALRFKELLTDAKYWRSFAQIHLSGGYPTQRFMDIANAEYIDNQSCFLAVVKNNGYSLPFAFNFESKVCYGHELNPGIFDTVYKDRTNNTTILYYFVGAPKVVEWMTEEVINHHTKFILVSGTRKRYDVCTGGFIDSEIPALPNRPLPDMAFFHDIIVHEENKGK